MDINNQQTHGSEESQAIDGVRLQQERDEYLDGWQRARADLANYKKDEAKRFDEVMKFANGAIIRELVTVLDNFDLAIASLEKQGVIDKGIHLIKSQLEDILKQYGLEKLTVEVGQPFDPALHEAIASVASDASTGTILEEIERGYYLQGKLIRPARVRVAE